MPAKKSSKKRIESSEAAVGPAPTKIDWRPLLVWLSVVVLIATLGYFAIEHFFPAPAAEAQDELVGTYGPYEVYKKDDHQYWIQINPEVIWTFRANPLDTISIPVFPFKQDFKAALADVTEVWITRAPEEDPRVVVAAMQLATTLGAQGYTVREGLIRQPENCIGETASPLCAQPILPLEFANENRTVFRMLGPKDNVPESAIYVMGNNIIIQAPDYDALDRVVVKAVLIMLNLA